MDPDGVNKELRIQISSKKQLNDQINTYKDVLKKVLDGQTEVCEKTKRVLLQELLANFEAAVRDNVLVKGKRWDEAPDEEDESVDLESLLDDTIVETSRRRRTYPRKILPHVVHSLKAERKLMTLFERDLHPQEVFKDLYQDDIMNNLSSAAPKMVKQAIEVFKSMNTLQKQAEGLCEILNMKPSNASLQIHQEVFGINGQSEIPLPSTGRARANRQPIKRATEDAAATDCYVPLRKKTDPSGTQQISQ
ncbi:kinetochore-associated protein NSL1 homolog [Thalassophryne amazonica]|uniref:kinetochore-associated protein NSL1 homolog n=1 Tax=Thalassophryne amazonica TaxID=390379 RepID=UPI00147153D8|nr:kinetochore-associated protein NSL1 homolog [Thalassophryne amazonica]